MNREQMIRVFKDPVFRSSLTEAEALAMIPHPSGPLTVVRQQDGGDTQTPNCSVGMSTYCGCRP